MQSGSLSAPPYVRPGIAAGLVGAVTLDAYLLLTVVAGVRALTFDGFYRHIASGVLGAAAYASPVGVPLGIALHVAVSLTWGIGYAYAAARTPQVRERPLVSGIVFGIVVMVAMQLVQIAANIYRIPSAAMLANSFVAHVAFFGIPVAYVTQRLLEPKAEAA